MGAWGAGSFDNDGALDFAGEISSAEDLLGPLSITEHDVAIDADQASAIIVVGECVAAMRGHPSSAMPADLHKLVLTFAGPSHSLYHHTRDHLSAVMERSELMELWAEDDPSEWNAAMHDLSERLGRKPQKPDAVTEPEKPTQVNPSPCQFCDQPMGAEEFSSFNIDIQTGNGLSMGIGGWAHLLCLNKALHPKHNIRHTIMNDEDMPDNFLDLLDEKPSLTDD